MKGPWKVSSNIIGDSRMYIAYRLRDICQVDHSGNREYCGEYCLQRLTVERLVEELNSEKEAK